MVLGLIVAVNCLKEFFGKEAGSMPDEEPEWSEMGKAEYGRAAAAEAPADAEAAKAYRGETLSFGPDYLIPKPFDPRLIGVVSTAVAKAAMETGVATRPLADIIAYKRKLDGSVFRSAMIMRPVFEAAATAKRRIVFAEGEDERVLRAANAMLE